MNDKTLYLECYSGISGDMTVASLLDLGADQKVLMEGLASLKVEGYQINIGRRAKNSIEACDFDVILENDDAEPHSHEHSHPHGDDRDPSSYSHSHSHKQDHDHPSHPHSHPHGDDHDPTSHSHSHSHEEDHSHNYAKLSRGRSVMKLTKPSSIHNQVQASEPTPIHFGHHDHRNLAIINDIIDSSSITDHAKAIAKRIFYIVAVAEAKAHGKTIDEVHFHEVGAIDSIVDIVAAAICLDNLKIKDVVVSEMYEGTGFIHCQHGLLPIPVPAVINIASEHHLPLHITNVSGELITPTGAAIVAAIRTKEALPKDMKIIKVGLGAGKRNYAGASGLLRAMLIEEATVDNQTDTHDQIWVLEANIDDCPGEALAYTTELLLQNGAKDAYYTPIYMKKNRPAYMLGVICSEDVLEAMEDIIFSNTTTIGIRKTQAVRTTLKRQALTVTTPYGDADVKLCHYNEKCFYYPEYESVKKLCEISGKDYLTIYHMVQALATEQQN